MMEVHDRDRCTERARQESSFGTERRDELLGTHAFGAGQNRYSLSIVKDKKCSWPGDIVHMRHTR